MLWASLILLMGIRRQQFITFDEALPEAHPAGSHI
jgi:hypothetical protein